jgi:hypothetical protein
MPKISRQAAGRNRTVGRHCTFSTADPRELAIAKAMANA